MLVGTLGTSLLGNILAGKGIVRASFFELLNFVWKQNRKGIVGACYGKEWDF